MSNNVTLRGKPVALGGALPRLGDPAPPFTLVAKDLSDMTLATFSGKRKVLNVFPSVDTPVCAASVRKFNEAAAGLDDTVVLCVSADLPFAQSRFCGAEGLDNVLTLSTMRGAEFLADYGVAIMDGPFAGLAARAVFVFDADDAVIHSQLVPDIGSEPDYEAALAVLK